MTDISGYGLRVTLRASVTFPAGLTISQFADDADPIDNPAADLAEGAMGLNGDLVTWASPQPLTLTLNVLPGMDDDRNLSVLAQRNVVGRGQRPARDTITAVILYPDGRQVTLARGALTNATLAPGVSSAGRVKTRAYTFMFEQIAFGG